MLPFKINAPFILVSSPSIKDSQFAESVVLVVEHTDYGAYGFVVNSQSELPIENVLENDVESFELTHIPVWNAGPVDSDIGYILHNQKPIQNDNRISEGVYLSSSQSSLFDFLENIDKELDCFYPYRLFIGYSGWGEGQLDKEINEGTWYQLPVDKELLFNTHHNQMWREALMMIGIKTTSQILDNQSSLVH